MCIRDRKSAIRRLAQQIARFRLKLVAYSLQHESKQDNHPQPVRTAEARTVEQRERCKERTAERYECSKRKLPLAPRRVYYHLALLFRLAQTEYQRVTALHKQQEYKDGSQQGYYKPPIMLKKYIGTVSYTHLRAHETGRNLVCRLLLEKKKRTPISYAVFCLTKKK